MLYFVGEGNLYLYPLFLKWMKSQRTLERFNLTQFALAVDGIMIRFEEASVFIVMICAINLYFLR